MCGIFSYVGTRAALPLLLEGLRRLEYRGYDSAGVAIVGEHLSVARAVGKIAELEDRVAKADLPGTCGIAHTRWATHGAPTEANAHPHRDCSGKIAVVHNGIIENHGVLRAELSQRGHTFTSDTDTEVLAHLIEEVFDGDLEAAVKRALTRVRGAFGIAVVHDDCAQQIVCARRGSPLVVGVGSGELFAASDVTPLLRHTRQVIHLEENEVATLTADGFNITSLSDGRIIDPKIETIDWEYADVELDGYPHYMLKEIFEQPEVIRNACRGRIVIEDGIPKLGGLESVIDKLRACRHLAIVSCGTSYYAGMAARYLFEDLTDWTVEVELASEFRYRRLNIAEQTVVLAISQSGETADTLAAIREAKRKGALCLGLVNAVGSSIARETDAGVYNHAGPEIGVASTKAFTSQLTILALMAVMLGRYKRLTVFGGKRVLQGLAAVPDAVQKVLDNCAHIEALAKKYADYEHFFYVGRKFHYPIALEGALKLKEIAYLHAEGYAAGELKHGPLALVDDRTVCIALCPADDLQEKTLSNAQEIKARGAKVIAVATLDDEAVRAVADDVIEIPDILDLALPIVEVVPLQLFAYYVAVAKGRDVDKPRNLAKSVTVE